MIYNIKQSIITSTSKYGSYMSMIYKTGDYFLFFLNLYLTRVQSCFIIVKALIYLKICTVLCNNLFLLYNRS